MEYDAITAVAALQALTIYFLVRSSEDNEDATNFDIPLVQTMAVCFRSAQKKIIADIFSSTSMSSYKQVKK